MKQSHVYWVSLFMLGEKEEMTYTLAKLNQMMKRNDGNLDLAGTQIKELPEGLTVGGSLDLRYTQIEELPDGLTVGGNLNLYGTQITQLPDGLTVGGSVYAIIPTSGVQRLKNGDYVPNKYLYADGILTHVKQKTQKGIYTYYKGKIRNQNVISDGKHYAHCENFKKGVCDLSFKRLKDRGAEQYKEYTLDTVLSFEDAKNMYRIITGACKAGTNQFIEDMKEIKDKYSVREIIELTRGAYGAAVFESFFERNN